MPSKPRQIRRIFFTALLKHLYVLLPIVSGVILVMIVAGLIVGSIEGWSVGESLYFTFVTGLTIGYGDFVPKHFLTRLLAVLIGFSGIVLTGLVAAVSVQALRATETEDPEQK